MTTRKPLASSHCCILHLGIPAPGAGMLHWPSCVLAVTAAPWPAGCGRSPHPGAKCTLDFGFAVGCQQPYGNVRGTATSTQFGARKDKARFVWDKSSRVSSLPRSSTLPPPPRKHCSEHSLQQPLLFTYKKKATRRVSTDQESGSLCLEVMQI